MTPQVDSTKFGQYVRADVPPLWPHGATKLGHRQRSPFHQDVFHRLRDARLVPVVVELGNGQQVDLVEPTLHQQSMPLRAPLQQLPPSSHHRCRIRQSLRQEPDLLIAKFRLRDPHGDAVQHAPEAERHCSGSIAGDLQLTVQVLLLLPTATHEYHANHQGLL